MPQDRSRGLIRGETQTGGLSHGVVRGGDRLCLRRGNFAIQNLRTGIEREESPPGGGLLSHPGSCEVRLGASPVRASDINAHRRERGRAPRLHSGGARSRAGVEAEAGYPGRHRNGRSDCGTLSDRCRRLRAVRATAGGIRRSRHGARVQCRGGENPEYLGRVVAIGSLDGYARCARRDRVARLVLYDTRALCRRRTGDHHRSRGTGDALRRAPLLRPRSSEIHRMPVESHAGCRISAQVRHLPVRGNLKPAPSEIHRLAPRGRSPQNVRVSLGSIAWPAGWPGKWKRATRLPLPLPRRRGHRSRRAGMCGRKQCERN